MKKIILIRHWVAEGKNWPKDDYLRDLIPEWIAWLYSNFESFSQILREIELVYCSGSNRTKQTLDCLLEFISPSIPEIVYDDIIYEKNGDWIDISTLISRTDPLVKTIAIVGHNPTLSSLYQNIDTQNFVFLERWDIAIIELQDDFINLPKNST